MVNIHKSTTGFGKHVCLQTIRYCYPFSEVKVTYDIGKGPKTHYTKVGFNQHGKLCMVSKNAIHKEAQKLIDQHLLYINKYVNKLRDINQLIQKAP